VLKETHGDNMDEFIAMQPIGWWRSLVTIRNFLNLMLIEMVEFKGCHAPLLFEKIMPISCLSPGR